MALQDHDLLKRELARGYEGQQILKSMLEREGFKADVPELKINPVSQFDDKYKDNGDVIVHGPVDYKLECKYVDKIFTGPDDWPFQKSIVDRVVTWERKNYKPIAIVEISQVTKGAVVISAKSRPRWTVETIYDKKRKQWFDYYMVNKVLLYSFQDLVDALRKKGAYRSNAGTW